MNVLRGKESRRRMVSESGLACDLVVYDTADSQVDLHRHADPKKPCAGILHAPLHIRNRKVNGRTPSVRRISTSAGSGVEPQSAVFRAKSSAHGVQHRTESEMDGSALRLKLQKSSVDQPPKC